MNAQIRAILSRASGRAKASAAGSPTKKLDTVVALLLAAGDAEEKGDAEDAIASMLGAAELLEKRGSSEDAEILTARADELRSG